MKHTSIVILLLLLLPLTVAAESKGSNSLVVWGEGGFATYVGKAEGIKPAIGGGGALGVGYEYRAQTFLLQTGLGAKFIASRFKIEDQNFDCYTIDDEGWALLPYQYQQRNRLDKYNQLSMQIPVLAGAHFDNLYFLAGVKLNFNVLTKNKVQATYRTVGYYEEFIDPFEDMDNHKFFTSQDFSTSNSSPFSFNLAASAEIGGEFLLKDERGSAKQYLRVAAFMDFNILPDSKSSSRQLIDYPYEYNAVNSLEDIQFVDVLNSSAVTKAMRQLFVGVKVTFLLTSPERFSCVICEGGYPSRRDTRRGSRILVQ